MSTEEEFLKALMAIPQLVEEPREYRLHYNQNGDIYMCTMQNHPVDTEYLVVTEQEYSNYANYKIVKGKLKKIDINPGYRVQLTRSTSGYCTVKNHAGIILENEEYNDTEYWQAN